MVLVADGCARLACGLPRCFAWPPRIALLIVLAVYVAGCSDDPQPLPRHDADRARAAIAQQAAAADHGVYSRAAQHVWASHECFAHSGGRIYCQVSYEDFVGDRDRYCTTGYTALPDGSKVRHVPVGDPAGPGFICGALSKDGDPFAPDG